MATNLAIDPELLERAKKLSGVRTKTAVVRMALEEFVARREQVQLLELFGALEWDDSFDYREERSRMRASQECSPKKRSRRREPAR